MKDSELEVLSRGLVLRLLADRPVMLLCRSVTGGYHYLPGGHVEFDEPAEHALRREFLEEADLLVRPGGLALIIEERFDQGARRRHEYNLVFHVEHLAGEDEAVVPTHRPPTDVRSREPAIAFEWVALDDLERIDLRPVRIGDWLRTHPTTRAPWLSS
ncbi:MAG: hypothetical protein Tsb0013_21140 [Phycisphaerales bacterium]